MSSKGVATAPSASNTASNSTKRRGRGPGKPFVPGDPRINRKGRPRSFDALRKLAQMIANEEQGGRTRAEQILREMATGDASQKLRFLEIAYGRVPDQVAIEADGTLTVRYINDWRRHALPDSVVDGQVIEPDALPAPSDGDAGDAPHRQPPAGLADGAAVCVDAHSQENQKSESYTK